jgi:hypothetical protein
MPKLLRDLVSAVVTEAVLPRVDPGRWARVGPTGGVVFGRHVAHVTRALAVLALEPDGSYRLAVATPAMVELAGQGEVREHVVLEGRRPYAPRGHAHEPSPVWPALCRLCARGPLDHEREAVEEVLRGRFPHGTQVRVDFAPGSARVAGVARRLPRAARPLLRPLPEGELVGAVEPERGDATALGAAPEWRDLNAAELASLLWCVGADTRRRTRRLR